MDTKEFVIQVGGAIRRPVVVNASSETEAKETLKDEFKIYEVKVKTIPYEGSTWETVFARNPEDAEVIATSRKGEYSDVPQDIELWKGHPEISRIEIESVEQLESEEDISLTLRRAIDECKQRERFQRNSSN